MAEDNSRYPGYTKLGIVGQGAFGAAVLYARESDGTKVVMKEVRLSDMDEQAVAASLTEVRVLSSLQHPNIVRYIGSRLLDQEDGGKLLVIETEWADGGTLQQLLSRRATEKRRLRELDVLYLLHQAASGLSHVHSKRVLHRDLKPANVLLTKDGRLKLADFGISKLLPMASTLTELATTVVGTPYYLSPEMCEGRGYDTKSDIWSLGCVLYETIELKRPFEATNLPQLVAKITSAEYEPISRRYTDALDSLVGRMLHRDPSVRPAAQRVFETEVPRVLSELTNRGRHRQLDDKSKAPTANERSVIYEFAHFKNEIKLDVVVGLPPVAQLADLAVGKNHFLAVTTDGDVYSWGGNEYAQLGLGRYGNELSSVRRATRITALSGRQITSVCAGDGFSIFCSSEGSIWSVGRGRSGCLGHGDWRDVSHPRLVGPAAYAQRLLLEYSGGRNSSSASASLHVTQLSCGPQHVAAVTTEGKIFTWGNGRDGRTAHGDEDYRCSPQRCRTPRDELIVKAWCGTDCTLALTDQGQLLAAGSNAHNKLGLSTFFRYCERSLSLIPVKLGRRGKVKDVAVGETHVAVLMEGGALVTAGGNGSGQLGRGHMRHDTYFREVRLREISVSAVACGTTYTAAATKDNVVHFWGTRCDYRKRGEEVSSGIRNIADQNDSSCEFVRQPEPVLGLYASPGHVSAGRLVWLVKLLPLGTTTAAPGSLLLWVNTTCPPPAQTNRNTSNDNSPSTTASLFPNIDGAHIVESGDNNENITTNTAD